jgi:hypothetical protein
MIGLHTAVTVGTEPGTVIARVTAHGRTTYSVRFGDGRVRSFAEHDVSVQVVRMPVKLRLVVDNSQEVRP